jgi:glycerol-3-phosphate O-acyltransferase
VGARFDEIFGENAALPLRLGAIDRVEEDLRPGSDVETLAFLAELVRPYLESYRITTSAALAVAHRFPMDRRALLREAMERGRASYLSGEVVLRESLSKATLGNAIEWMVDQGMLLELDAGRLRLPKQGAEALQLVVEEIGRHLV